ncbi:hypothetical protein BDW75DRAFT_202069 [Aspergillus navahoensis]
MHKKGIRQDIDGHTCLLLFPTASFFLSVKKKKRRRNIRVACRIESEPDALLEGKECLSSKPREEVEQANEASCVVPIYSRSPHFISFVFLMLDCGQKELKCLFMI